MGVRRSRMPVISIVGVFTFPTYMIGERRRYSLGSSQNGFSKFSYQLAPSVRPTKLIQLITGQSDAAAAKRSVCPTVHAVRTPPPEQPVTYRLFASMYPRPTTVSTPAIKSSKSLSGYAFLISLVNL